MSHPSSAIAGRYQIIRQLGQGGMGVVYLVKHVNTGELHALKVLHSKVEINPESLERFRREMKVPARIKSEHVVKITDADVAPELNGAMFYVMELLSGCDLAQFLKHRNCLNAIEIVWIFRQLAKVLDKAHQNGIVHRDLKPENIYIHKREDDSPLVKILDFGLARFTEEARVSGNDRNKLTNTQAMLGTPMYMAPEQGRAGDQPEPIGPPADIWALGMVAYELLTGKTYWSADSLVQLVGQLFFAEMPAPSQKSPQVPPVFDAWFKRSCSRNQSERWATAGQQVHELGIALGVPDSSVQQVPESVTTALSQIEQGIELTLPEAAAQPIPIVVQPPSAAGPSPDDLAATPRMLTDTESDHDSDSASTEAETQILRGERRSFDSLGLAAPTRTTAPSPLAGPPRRAVLGSPRPAVLGLVGLAVLLTAGSVVWMSRSSDSRSGGEADGGTSRREPGGGPPLRDLGSPRDLATAAQRSSSTMPGAKPGKPGSTPGDGSKPPVRRSNTGQQPTSSPTPTSSGAKPAQQNSPSKQGGGLYVPPTL